MLKGKPLAKKLATCIVAGLTSIALILVLGNSGTIPWFPPILVFSMVAIVFLIAIIYPFIWHRREIKNSIRSQKIYGVLYAIIRYTIAFNLASFGWKKLFGLQFIVPPEIASLPMNQQSGEWLTWYYFGHSAVFGTILALIQIIGSWLLLFRKTAIAAALVLFAFMLNLTLINIFYQMNAGALLQSILLTIGIGFTVLSEYKKLLQFLFKMASAIPSVELNNGLLKNALRLSAIVLSLLFTLYLKYFLFR